MSKTDQPDLWYDGPPAARNSDPSTSHQAARAVRPAREALHRAIRDYVGAGHGPISADQIVWGVERQHPGRWARGTIVTAISSAGLTVVDENGRSDRGRPCSRYSL